MFPSTRPIGFSIVIAGLMTAVAASPGATSASQYPVTADSSEILGHVRDAQRRFELLRRNRLPWTYSSWGSCDIRIGRYCFRFDHDEPTWDPPPEDEDVTAERTRLIGALDSAFAALPGDRWIVTQFIRYLVEDDELERALSTASRCQAEEFWCHALKGFVAHAMRSYETSEQAFNEALVLMPSEMRCEWEDVSELVTGDVRGTLRALPCDERTPLLDSLFWLSDPLYLVPGNELRSEHFARLVGSEMYRQAKGPDPDRWNETTHRITMRYGLPKGWQRVRGSPTELRASLVTHYGTDGAAFFFPKREYLEDPSAIEAGAWDINPDRPQSNHDPAYAENGFQDLQSSFAMFRRRDSTLVVTSAAFTHDSLIPGAEILFAMVLTEGPYEPPVKAVRLTRDTTAVLVVTGAPRTYLASVEVLAEESKVAGRARQGIDLSRMHGSGLIASDVLMLSPEDSVPESVEEALKHLRRPGVFRPGERFTLYWELYGLDPSNHQYSTTISLDKTSKGFFRRLAELTPFTSHQPAVHVGWDETGRPEAGTTHRGLVVDLPGELSEGDYRLTLTIETPSGAHVERRLQLRVAR